MNTYAAINEQMERTPRDGRWHRDAWWEDGNNWASRVWFRFDVGRMNGWRATRDYAPMGPVGGGTAGWIVERCEADGSVIEGFGCHYPDPDTLAACKAWVDTEDAAAYADWVDGRIDVNTYQTRIGHTS